MRAGLVVGALLVASCAPSLEELAPFPCVSDYDTDRCPDGFSCFADLCVPTGSCEGSARCESDALPKCVAVGDAEYGDVDSDYTMTCVPVPDNQLASEGQACVVASPGFDTCAPGLTCDNVWSQTPICRATCSSRLDCAQGAQCMALSQRSPAAVCVADCSSDQAACAPGACSVMASITGSIARVCTGSGSVPLSATCDGAAACRSGEACIDGQCTVLCSDAVACPPDMRCKDGAAGELDGTCQCSFYGTACGDGYTCGYSNSGAVCESRTGTLPLYANCTEGDHCPASSVCWGVPGRYFCRPLCDDQHPCQPGDGACDVRPQFVNGGGVCGG